MISYRSKSIYMDMKPFILPLYFNGLPCLKSKYVFSRQVRVAKWLVISECTFHFKIWQSFRDGLWFKVSRLWMFTKSATSDCWEDWERATMINTEQISDIRLFSDFLQRINLGEITHNLLGNDRIMDTDTRLVVKSTSHHQVSSSQSNVLIWRIPTLLAMPAF
jgi:hypothetical protein